MANPTVLVQQLTLLAENPEAFSQHRSEIISLARKATAALETPFETFQRLAYSVCRSFRSGSLADIVD